MATMGHQQGDDATVGVKEEATRPCYYESWVAEWIIEWSCWGDRIFFGYKFIQKYTRGAAVSPEDRSLKDPNVFKIERLRMMHDRSSSASESGGVRKKELAIWLVCRAASGCHHWNLKLKAKWAKSGGGAAMRIEWRSLCNWSDKTILLICLKEVAVHGPKQQRQGDDTPT